MLVCFPTPEPKGGQTGGWAGVCHYQTQPRYPVEASMRMEIRRPRTGPAGRRGTPGPATPPRRPAFGCHWISKRIYNNQNEETHPFRKYQGWSGKITKNPTSASTGCPVPQWKNSKSYFTQRNQIHPIPFLQPAQAQEDRAHLRHPTNWGIMDRAATGPEDAKPPTAQ